MEKTTVKKAVKRVPKELKEKKPVVKKEEKKPEVAQKVALKPGKYYEAVGRRKTAIARVRLFANSDKKFVVNEKTLEQYFLDSDLQGIAKDALGKMDCIDKFSVSVRVKGGGIHAQAEAIRHGISRVLIAFDPDFRKRLKKTGFLTRDPRMRERKKFGLKRARRAPQWAKR
jgi:small subunit ribosomal protein S9